jgi:hypothetical protein
MGWLSSGDLKERKTTRSITTLAFCTAIVNRHWFLVALGWLPITLAAAQFPNTKAMDTRSGFFREWSLIADWFADKPEAKRRYRTSAHWLVLAVPAAGKGTAWEFLQRDSGTASPSSGPTALTTW